MGRGGGAHSSRPPALSWPLCSLERRRVFSQRGRTLCAHSLTIQVKPLCSNFLGLDPHNTRSALEVLRKPISLSTKLNIFK